MNHQILNENFNQQNVNDVVIPFININLNDNINDNPQEAIDENLHMNMNQFRLLQRVRNEFNYEPVGRNVYNTFSDLQEANWLYNDIMAFLDQLFVAEEDRLVNLNYNVNIYHCHPREQMEAIEDILDEYEEIFEDGQQENQLNNADHNYNQNQNQNPNQNVNVWGWGGGQMDIQDDNDYIPFEQPLLRRQHAVFEQDLPRRSI